MRATCLTLCMLLGCSISPEGGTSLGGGSAEVGGAEGEASSNAASSEDEGGSSGEDESSDGGGTITPSDSSSGAVESSGALDDGDASSSEVGGDVPPLHDYYQACTTDAECASDPGLACLKADQNGAQGFCSAACGTMGASPPDPQLCPPAPAGVTATVVCVDGFIRNCALSCVGDGECPGGTACLPANNGGGPYCFGT
ncbi:MAG TPA: hypothetical protein VG755_13060 [Nannocystaceae bacterium]|nr:hypothetical protein [Nannocystaceae bacterium]